MIRLGALLGVLLICAGCTAPGDRAQWEEAMKDLRGDNMQMRGGTSSVDGMDRGCVRAGLP
jgi:hypothetical protein